MSRGAYILSVIVMKQRIIGCRTILSVLLVAAGAAAAVGYNEECARGIANGLSFCTGVLIPSLFLFMVLTAYCIKSGAFVLIAKPFGWLGRLMGLPAEAATAILTAMLGGYPIGAGCTALLYEQGQLSASEAAKTACIAVAAGPGFIISYIGRSLLQDPLAADILLGAQTAAVLLTGVIIGRCVRCTPPPHRGKVRVNSAGALVGAIRSAADATFTMCAAVVLFAAVIEIISSAADSGAADIASAFLEVTTGCSRLSTRMPLYFTAFFIGFGGLSVHCQIFACLKNVPVNKPLFLLTRIVQGIIAMLATYILLMITPMETPVFSTTDAGLSAGRSATYAGSGALILAALSFVGSVSGRIRRLKQCAE